MSQFFQIHAETPQKRLIEQAVHIIKQGGVIAYPTDSGYALGCQINHKNALERIIQIRQLSKKHQFTLMCHNLSQVSRYTHLDNQAFRFLKTHTPNPYTFILKATKEVPNRLTTSAKKTIGIRIPHNKICLHILEALGEPLTSTSLILPHQTEAEFDPFSIRDQLEHHIDLVIDGGCISEEPTTIIDLTSEPFSVLRQGAGNISVLLDAL